MTDKLKTEVKLKPIRVPDYIIADVQQETKFHVSELSHETLNALAEKFRMDLLDKHDLGLPDAKEQ